MATSVANERAVRPIPAGYHTLTPVLTVHDGAAAIEFYVRAFGATEQGRATTPDGRKIWHADLQIGDSRLMLNDEFPEMGCSAPSAQGGSPVSLWLYVEDVDASFERAVAAGATAVMAPDDMFWGDRFGAVKDPFGHEWRIATHVREHDAAEEQRAREAWEARQG